MLSRAIRDLFFQAEDGIRDGHVTGVQTCALPIFKRLLLSGIGWLRGLRCGRIGLVFSFVRVRRLIVSLSVLCFRIPLVLFGVFRFVGLRALPLVRLTALLLVRLTALRLVGLLILALVLVLILILILILALIGLWPLI